MISGERMPSPNSPMAVARILAAEREHLDGLTLRHWRGTWMNWTGSHWIEGEHAALRSELYKRLEGCYYPDKNNEPASWLPNKTKITNLLEALAAVVHLPGTADMPSWSPHRDSDPIGTCVACTNGVLEVSTRTLHQPTPRYFTSVAVPFPYRPGAAVPTRWMEFLDELWPDDPDSIAALQEWFGYVLSGRTDLQKMLMLIGPTRSGKGTIARILAQLAGSIAGPTLLSLGTDFGLASLLGKTLAIISDARLGRGHHVQVVVERLLSISGEDILDVNRKYKEPWTGKLGTRMMVLSNEIPQFGDESAAISGRFVVLSMNESFLGREDHTLYPALCAELPGILEWSLDGLDRLTRRGTFTDSAAGADAARTMRDLASPISSFVQERCELGDHLTPVDDVWAAWKQWAEESGVSKSSRQWLGRSLRAAVPRVRTMQPRGNDGRQYRAFAGIRLTDTHRHAQNRDSRDYPPYAREEEENPLPINGDGQTKKEISVSALQELCPTCDAPIDDHLPGCSLGATTA